MKDLLSKKEKQRVTKPLSCLRFGSDANILKRSSKWKVPGMEPDFSETSKIERAGQKGGFFSRLDQLLHLNIASIFQYWLIFMV